MKTTAGTAGFTLTEVLVAVLVLSMSIVATSNFLVSMIHSNVANTSSLQAYYYAQEGIEAFRNMRDTHFMHNVHYCGKDAWIWGLNGGFYEGCNGGKNYTVALNKSVIGSVPAPSDDLNNISNVSTWELGVGFVGGGGGEVYFQKSPTEAVLTGFERSCTVESFDAGVAGGKAAKVTCTIDWEESGRDRTFSLSTILTDWKHE